MNFYTKIKNLTDNQKRMLIAEKPNAKYNLFYQAHPELKNEVFFKPDNDGFIIPTGLLEILNLWKKPETPQDFKDSYTKTINTLKPFDLYDFQYNALYDALYNERLMIKAATGSGKSLVIALLVKILVDKGLKGLILVPNISLVKQFDSDLKSYNLYLNPLLVGGNEKGFKNIENSNNSTKVNIENSSKLVNSKSNNSTLVVNSNNVKVENSLIISTWQSLKNNIQVCKTLDFLIIDEAHSAKAEEIYKIAKSCINAKKIIGLTGTIPQNAYDFLKVSSVFGLPRNYVSPRNLIDRGLGTNIKVNLINIKYNNFAIPYDYNAALNFIIKNPLRNNLIVNLAKRLNGNTVILVSRNEMAFRLFKMLMPCKTDEKSYKDLNLQMLHNVFFINGSIPGETREIIRNKLENIDKGILISNYSIMGTGVNIKNLHNLIFASPLKSYITITQSLGRLIRTHDSKTEVNVYDLADFGGVFTNQKKKRIEECYKPQDYRIIESSIDFKD